MNNKGFSLIELIVVISLIALVLIIIVKISGNTLSLSDSKADEITYDNIVKATKQYLLECENDLLPCNYVWKNNQTSFSANDLIEAGYFKSLTNSQNKDISNCLIINATKENNDYKIELDDQKCK